MWGDVRVFFPFEFWHTCTNRKSQLTHTHTSLNGSSILLSFFSALSHFLSVLTDLGPVFVWEGKGWGWGGGYGSHNTGSALSLYIFTSTTCKGIKLFGTHIASTMQKLKHLFGML